MNRQDSYKRTGRVLSGKKRAPSNGFLPGSRKVLAMPKKTFLREKILKKRRTIPPGARRAKSCKIFSKLFTETLFKKARHIAFYCGIAPEVSTRPFLKGMLGEKRIYLPQTDPVKKTIKLRRIRVLPGDLHKGPYGIMEPKVSCPVRSAAGMDLIIVPGVAFDRSGGRLGRGAGYYDRLLRKAGRVPKIGLCFREQLVKKIPMKQHDMSVDKIITD